VAAWIAAGEDTDGDVAGLVLDGEPPERAQPTMIARVGDIARHPFLTFGYLGADDLDAGVWISGELRQTVTSDWLQLTMGDRDDGLWIERGFSGTPVFDQHSGQVVGLVAAVYTEDVRCGYAIPGDAFIDGWDQLSAGADQANPFRSLQPFDIGDSRYFFGRDDVVDTIVDRLRRERLLVLTGASGAGKSSLLGAGIAARLAGRPGDLAVIVRIEPAGSPWLALISAVLGAVDEGRMVDIAGYDRFAAELEHGNPQSVLLRWLRNPRRRLYLLIDDFEAVFAAGDDVAARFGETLDRLASAQPSRQDGTAWFRIVVAIRSDALSELDAIPGWQGRRAVELAGLSGERLREAVEAPVRLTGQARYEQGLVDRIVADAGEQPYSLSLVQATLSELWQRRDRSGELTHRAYQQVRADGGPLAHRVQAAWDELSTVDQAEAGRLVPHLATRLDSGSFARRVCRRSELDDSSWPVANLLATGRVVVVVGRPRAADTVELAHEALITGAPALEGILRDNVELIEWRDRNRRRIAAPSDDPDRRLLDRSEVAAATAMAERHPAMLTDREREFLRLSTIRVRRDRRRVMAGVLAFATLVVAVLGLGGWFVYWWQTEARNAARSEALSLLEDAESADADGARDYAMSAWQTLDAPWTRAAALAANDAFAYVDSVHRRGAGGQVVSADGNHLLSYLDQPEVDIDDLRQPSTPGASRKIRVTAEAADINADGTRVVLADVADGLSVWDPGRQTPLAQFPVPRAALGSGPVAGVAMDRSGRTVAVLTTDRLALLDARNGKVTGAAVAVGKVYEPVAMAFVGEGRSVLMRLGSALMLAHLPARGRPSIEPIGLDPASVWLSADQRSLLSCHAVARGFDYRSLDLTTGRTAHLVHMEASQSCGAALLAPGGAELLRVTTGDATSSTSGAGLLEVWSVARGVRSARFPIPVAAVDGLRPNLVIVGDPYTVQIASDGNAYRIRLPRPDTFDHGLRAASSVQYAPAGDLAATVDLDGSITTWNAGTGARIATTETPPRTEIRGFSRDGTRLLTLAERTATVWTDHLAHVGDITAPGQPDDPMDGTMAIAGDQVVWYAGGVARRWTTTGQALGPAALIDPDTDGPAPAAFDPGSARLYTLDRETGIIHAWDLETMVVRDIASVSCRVEDGTTAELLVDPAGKVLSVDADDCWTLIDLSDGRRRFVSTSPGTVMGWTDDLRSLVVTTYGDGYQSWHITPDPGRPFDPSPAQDVRPRFLTSDVVAVRADGGAFIERFDDGTFAQFSTDVVDGG
jgi:hypothetical protein